jgi:hypothetical protein
MAATAIRQLRPTGFEEFQTLRHPRQNPPRASGRARRTNCPLALRGARGGEAGQKTSPIQLPYRIQLYGIAATANLLAVLHAIHLEVNLPDSGAGHFLIDAALPVKYLSRHRNCPSDTVLAKAEQRGTIAIFMSRRNVDQFVYY